MDARRLAAQTARRQGNFVDAGEHLRILSQNHVSPDVLTSERRLLALASGDLTEAEEAAAECRRHPNDADTAPLLEALIAGALKVLSPPASSFPFENTGQAGPLLETTRGLVDLWLKTQPKPPDQAAGFIWRARVQAVARDYPGAMADLRQALALDPDNFDANFYYGLWIGQESPNETRARFERLARMFPEDRTVLMTLAIGYRSLGLLEQSAEILDRLIAGNPSPPLLLERAQVYLDLQKPEQAEPLLRRVLASGSNPPELFLALARCMTLQDKPDEAKRYQDRFRELEQPRTPAPKN